MCMTLNLLIEQIYKFSIYKLKFVVPILAHVCLSMVALLVRSGAFFLCISTGFLLCIKFMLCVTISQV